MNCNPSCCYDIQRGAIPQQDTKASSVRSISEFIDFLSDQSGDVVDTIRTIYFNLDGNNRTGHLKQGYYAVPRFLQEHPTYLGPVVKLKVEVAERPISSFPRRREPRPVGVDPPEADAGAGMTVNLTTPPRHRKRP
jgi:hypothetical protein